MKTRHNAKKTGRIDRRILNGVTLLALVGIGIAALTVDTEKAVSAQPAIPSGYALASWQENGAGGRYLLEVTDGQVPLAGTSVSGVVLSDGNCTPDDEGLSHCHNDIRLADGSMLSVIDNHNMGENRCLIPGEAVSVSAHNDAWAVVLTEDAFTSE